MLITFLVQAETDKNSENNEDQDRKRDRPILCGKEVRDQKALFFIVMALVHVDSEMIDTKTERDEHNFPRE